jgi:hypothetical protein
MGKFSLVFPLYSQNWGSFPFKAVFCFNTDFPVYSTLLQQLLPTKNATGVISS